MCGVRVGFWRVRFLEVNERISARISVDQRFLLGVQGKERKPNFGARARQVSRGWMPLEVVGSERQTAARQTA